MERAWPHDVAKTDVLAETKAMKIPPLGPYKSSHFIFDYNSGISQSNLQLLHHSIQE